MPLIVELPDLIDAADFIAETIDPPAELIDGILHKGSKLVLGGSSKSFKTWTLLDLAISVAVGADWLGRQTAQGKVLFLNFEIQPHAWQRRIVAVAAAKGVELKAGQIILWNLRGHAADFRQLIPRIIQRCRAENFALIVLDPIYKLYGGTDENAAGDVAALLNSLETLATQTGAAIAFGAHFAKGNASAKEAIDRISGSGVFARDPDSLLIFTKHETDDAFTVEPILRNFAPVEPFAVRWDFPLMQLADDLDPAKLKQVDAFLDLQRTRTISFSFNELCRKYAHSNGGRYARAIGRIVADLMDSYIRVGDVNTGETHEYRLIDEIDIENGMACRTNLCKTPDATTLLNFRHLLETHDLCKGIFTANRVTESQHLILDVALATWCF